MIERRSRARIPALLTLLAALACGGGREPGSMAVVLRFIESPPQETFRREAVVEDRPVFDWRLEPHDVTAAWLDPRPPRRIALPDVAIDLAWENRRLSLVAAVDLDAAAVDRIDLMAESLTPGNERTGDVAFYWAGPEDRLDESRRLVVTDGETIAPSVRRYRLRLAGEPGWRGPIARLKVVWVVPKNVRLRILRAAGFDETIDPERLRELAAGGLKAAIGEQFRDALPALPGAAVERRLVPPPGAELRFAYGLQSGVREPVRFTVAVVAPGERHPVFDQTVAEAGWREAAVDLGAWAGEEVRIVLETAAAGELDPARGLPLWGHPQVLAPR